MKTTYDKEADAVYLRVRTGKPSKTVEVRNSLIVDFDQYGRVLGIEILDVSRQMTRNTLSDFVRRKSVNTGDVG